RTGRCCFLSRLEPKFHCIVGALSAPRFWGAGPRYHRKIRGTPVSNKVTRLKPRSKPAAALDTPTDLDNKDVEAVSEALNGLLATSFALFLKTKNFHWHVSGPHFRDYHLLLDDQAAEILGATDDMAERVRKIGGTTLRSIGHIAKLQNIEDNDEDFVP